VGFRYSDFLILKGCLDEGCTVTYETLGLPALSAGLEAAASVDRFSLLLTADEGFNAVAPFLTEIRLGLGAKLADSLAADVSLRSTTRKIGVYGSETGTLYGELADQQAAVTVGIGFAR
jgi:hypothetical protein